MKTSENAIGVGFAPNDSNVETVIVEAGVLIIMPLMSSGVLIALLAVTSRGPLTK